jgi:hypothetical protein
MIEKLTAEKNKYYSLSYEYEEKYKFISNSYNKSDAKS